MVDILNVCFELHQHLHVKLITNIESKIHTHKREQTYSHIISTSINVMFLNVPINVMFLNVH